MTELAIVVLNYNGKEILNRHLPDLINFSGKHPIFVADNGSTDGSLEFIYENFPSIHTIDLKKNWGYAEGYNRALETINSHFYILINSDVKVTHLWADELLHVIKATDDVAVVQPKIRSYYNPEYFEYAGAAGGFIDSLGYPYCRGRIFEITEKDEGQYDQLLEIDWASGSCFIIKSEIFHKHKFDADFFAHMEEIDLCWRIRNAGYKIIFSPQIIIYHEGGGTLAYSNPNKTYLNFRNGLLLLIKNYSTIDFILLFPTRILLDHVAALLFLIKGQKFHAWAVFKAHYNVFKRLRYWMTKRNKGPKKQNRRFNSIVFSYFIIGKKSYSLLNQR